MSPFHPPFASYVPVCIAQVLAVLAELFEPVRRLLRWMENLVD